MLVYRKDVKTKCPIEEDIKKVKNYYNSRWKKEHVPNKYSLMRGIRIIEHLNSLPIKNPKILDLGCGSGWFSNILSNFGTVTAVDLSCEAIKIAKDNYPSVNFIAGDFFTLKLPLSYFDVVISMEVIEHVKDQQRYIKIINDVLVPSGYLILTTPNLKMKNWINMNDWDIQPIENWLTMKMLKGWLLNDFVILSSTTIIPCGDKGIFRFLNSRRLNDFISIFLDERKLQTLKENM